MVCEVNYPDAVVEKDLLVKLHPALPEHIVVKMVDFANEIEETVHRRFRFLHGYHRGDALHENLAPLG